jgi:hypothetical protein
MFLFGLWFSILLNFFILEYVLVPRPYSAPMFWKILFVLICYGNFGIFIPMYLHWFMLGYTFSLSWLFKNIQIFCLIKTTILIEQTSYVPTRQLPRPCVAPTFWKIVFFLCYDDGVPYELYQNKFYFNL